MRTWMFLTNPFLNATDGSYLNGMHISGYHDKALEKKKSDPFFLDMYNLYHPLHIAYATAYGTGVTEGGLQQGDTLSAQQLMSLLSNTKIRNWDVAIQNHYEINTPEYKRLLPHHRKPFQHGSRTERLQTVKSLRDAIGTDELLAAVKTDVDSFYTQFHAANNVQEGNQSASKGTSAALETARIAMCAGQYANLGGLMQKYSTTPDMIAPYFDLETIRRSQQVLFTGKIKAGEIRTIVKHTFGEDDEIWLSNTGNTQLKFYLANAKGVQPGDKSITLDKGEQSVLASALGKLTDTYLTVFNTNTVHEGAFSIELI